MKKLRKLLKKAVNNEQYDIILARAMNAKKPVNIKRLPKRVGK